MLRFISMLFRSLCANMILLSSIFIGCLLRVHSQYIEATGLRYVVAIPDIHGDFDRGLSRALWLSDFARSNIISNFTQFRLDLRSSALNRSQFTAAATPSADTLLVQLGDIVDRGPDSLLCYNSLEAVEMGNPTRLISLIGNHEALTLAGLADDYVSSDDIKQFGGVRSRRAQFNTGGRLWSRITDNFVLAAVIRGGNSPSSDPSALLSLDSVDTLFVHAGMEPKWIDRELAVPRGETVNVTEMNSKARRLLKESPRHKFWTGGSSPVWTRLLAQGPDEEVCDHLLPQILHKFSVARMVVGHTPQETGRMTSRCGSRLILADTGISRWVSGDGHPAALVMELSNNGRILEDITAYYYEDNKIEKGVLYKRPATDSGSASASFSHNDRTEL